MTSANFSYDGVAEFAIVGNNTTYVDTLALRYVSGELRGLALTVGPTTPDVPNALKEFAIPTSGFDGATIDGSDITDSWTLEYDNFYRSAGGNHQSITWNEDESRLWLVCGDDYTDQFTDVRIFKLQLGSGSVTQAGPVAMEGINSKMVGSGLVQTPQWVQSAYGFEAITVGYGGYRSLVGSAVAPASLGGAFFSIPMDLTPYLSGGEIPATDFKTFSLYPANEVPVGQRIWYNYTFTPDGGHVDLPGYPNTPTGTFSGIGPINYTGPPPGGDPRSNPSTAPNFEPVPFTYLEPNTLGNAYWTWGDYYAGGMWADGVNYRGFMPVASLGAGRIFYQGSAVETDNRICEGHIYDEAILAAAAAGSLPLDEVMPTTMFQFEEPSLIGCRAYAAAYDPVGSKLYIVATSLGAPSIVHKLFRYSVVQ